MIDISDSEFNLLKEHLRNICGIEVPTEKRYLFKTRLSDFLLEESCRSFSDLCLRLNRSTDEQLQNRLIQAMTTHESSFFRDGHPFDLLRGKLLPEIAERRAAEAKYLPPRIRILSCGCSLGQEPYSIAMCVKEWLQTQETFGLDSVTIVGIDVSDQILARAKKGLYTQLELGRFLPDSFKTRYFKDKDGLWEVSSEIRDMVRFVSLNLVGDINRVGKLDLIFCRNVIIYFSPELKREILSRLRQLLLPGGVLLLGASESLYRLTDAFDTTHAGRTTYYVPR